MNLSESLKRLGLTPSEIQIYLYLLEFGVSTPPQVAKGTGIQRTNSYHVLRSLMEKGLVLEQSKGSRKVYLTNDPEALVLSLEQKKNIARELLPDLRGLRNIQRNKPTIRFFDGLTQIEEIYWLALEAEEITALGSTERLYSLLPAFTEKWLSEVKKRNIVLHDIVTHASAKDAAQKMKDSLKGLYDSKTLPAKIGELSTDVLLWKDNLALITLEEPYFGTILTNASLTRTLKQVLGLLRESL